ncbi:MAG: hypothetical protein FJ291_12635 [Planctomycetes bacterium]|nr:hypothetical protein [Planctomycetota bacterium]
MESARYDLEFREGQPVLGALRPVFAAHAKVTTQRFRDQVWFVAQDPVSLQYFRFGPTEHRVVKLLDGRHTLREIHLAVQQEMGAEAPSFQDVVAFVQMLRSANLLQAAESAKLDALYKRVKKRRSQRAKQLFANFLFPQIPLYDPERFLVRATPHLRWLFSRWSLAVWALAVLVGLGLFLYHVRDLAKPAERVLAPENLLLLWATFAVLKLIHEFAHAFLAKHFGAEVHRMGVMFLIFTPCAYVDVTGMWGVESKTKRALVAAAGMMAELFIATWALVVWLLTAPGTVHSIAYNVIFIASVSSVLFNGNPLLRYDAYYMLADWAELPNLWTNSRRYILYLGSRWLLGLEQDPPTRDPREKVWFVAYGVASFWYRTLVVIGIILFIASSLFGLGLLLGIGAAIVWILIPLGKLVHYLLFAKATRRHRARCVAVFAAVVAAVVLPLALWSLPQHIYSPCALAEQERAAVRARWRGFVEEVFARDGEQVRAGQLIARCRNEELGYDATRAAKQLEIARIRLAALEKENNLAAAGVERKRIGELEETLAVLRQRIAALTLTAPCDGRLIAPDIANAPGRFLNIGDPIAIVAREPFTKVVVVIDQASIADVRQAQEQTAAVRFHSQPDVELTCHSPKVFPQATHEVPSPGLTDRGGGPVLLDPSDPEGNRTLLPWFRVELEVPSHAAPIPLGATGTARFQIARKPLIHQWYYKLLRLLRTRFYL